MRKRYKEGDTVVVRSPRTGDTTKAVVLTERLHGYSVKDINTGEQFFVNAGAIKDIVTIDIEENDLFLLLGACQRYSMGRMTYMPMFTLEMFKKYGHLLCLYSLENIHDEVNNELEKSARAGVYIGEKEYHQDWIRLRDLLKKLISDARSSEDV